MFEKLKRSLKDRGQSRSRRRSVFFLLFFSYIVIMSVSMLWSYAYFLQTDAEVRTQSQVTMELLLKQQTSELDNSVAGISRISDKLVFNDNLTIFAARGELYSIEELQNELIDLGPADTSILDYYVYLRNSDMVVTPNLRLSAYNFYNMIYSYTGKDFNEWKTSMWSQYRFAEFQPVQEMSILGEKKNVITYIQSIPVNRYSEPQAQIVVLLDADKLRNRLEEMRGATASHIYILNSAGELLLSSVDAPTLSEEVTNNLIKGEKHLRSEKEKLFISSAIGEKSRWQVVVTTPENEYFKVQYRLRNRFMIEFGLMIIIGLAVSYIFTRKGYRPIKEIMEMVGPEKEETGSNELDNIKTSILHSRELQLKMSDTIEKHKPFMRNDYLVKVLRGIDSLRNFMESGEEKISERLKELDIHFDSELFMTVSVSLDLNSAFFQEEGRYPEVDIAMGTLALENICCELLENKKVQHYFVNMDRNLCVFLINLKSASQTTLVDEAFRELETVIIENFNLQYYGGQSGILRGIKQARVCFDQSLKAQEYGTLNGKKGVTHYHNVADLEYDYYYPIEQELQLVNLLKAGDEEGAKELLHSVLDINFSSRQIGAQAGKCLFVELAGTFAKVANNLMAKDGGKAESLDSFYEAMQSSAPVEEKWEKLCEMITSICKLSNKKQINQTERLVERIADYISTSEEWLDLSSIAEKFDITPQYLSTVFKKYKEVNVKEFISKKRLDKAKEYLVETDMTIDEIARKLGYANETGLNRLFKKYEGITPGAYRNSLKS